MYWHSLTACVTSSKRIEISETQKKMFSESQPQIKRSQYFISNGQICYHTQNTHKKRKELISIAAIEFYSNLQEVRFLKS